MSGEITMRDEQGKTQEESLRVFSEAASTYDCIGPRYFSHFGQRLVDLAQIVPGTKVLDVATGRGAVLFPASTRVGSRGHVIGIDFSTDIIGVRLAFLLFRNDQGYARDQLNPLIG
jgi:ubiquinone/menaquinone biosynthesis C-methylase UbiE